MHAGTRRAPRRVFLPRARLPPGRRDTAQLLGSLLLRATTFSQRLHRLQLDRQSRRGREGSARVPYLFREPVSKASSPLRGVPRDARARQRSPADRPLPGNPLLQSSSPSASAPSLTNFAGLLLVRQTIRSCLRRCTLEASRRPHEEILRTGGTLGKIVEPHEGRVFEELGNCCDARMFHLISLGNFDAHFERGGLVVEQVSHLLLKVLFLEAKREPIEVGQFLKEFLLVGEAEGVSSVGAHEAVVGPRDGIG